MFVELVLWWRQVFCEHQFKYEDIQMVSNRDFPYKNVRYTKVYMHCPVCGYHKTYRK